MPRFYLVDDLAQYRSPNAYVREAASTSRTYGDDCYLCGRPNNNASSVIPVKQPYGSTDETICSYCMPLILGHDMEAPR